MGLHRGATIYIPIIVPENVPLAVSLGCGIFAFVFLVFTLTVDSWAVSHFTVPGDGVTRAFDVDVVWGIRSMHIRWCERGVFPRGDNRDIQVCGSEDIRYSSCGPESAWCSSAADPWIPQMCILGSTIGLLLSTIFALSKRVFQPVGYSVCVVASSVSVVLLRAMHLLLEPSGYLYQWMKMGTGYTTNQGLSYFVLTGATFLLLIGMFFASYGTWLVAKADAATEGGDTENTPGTGEVVEENAGDTRTAGAAATPGVTGVSAAPPTSRPPPADSTNAYIRAPPPRPTVPKAPTTGEGSVEMVAAGEHNSDVDFSPVNEPTTKQ